MSDDNPILWNMKFQWNQTMDVEMVERFSGNTSMNFSVETDIDRDLAKENDSVTASGSLEVSASEPHSTVRYVPGGEASVKSMTLSRRFDTGLPELTGDDDPSSSQPPGSFQATTEFHVQSGVTTTLVNPETGQPVSYSGSCEMPELNMIQFDFPYKPGVQQTHDGEKDVQDYLTKAAAEFPVPLLFSNPKGSVQYTLQQKNLDIRLDKKGVDLIPYTSYKGNTALSPNLCYYAKAASPEEESYFLHGNFFVQVTVDGKEQVQLGSGVPDGPFHIWRIGRNWSAPVDASGNPGAFVGGDWFMDNTGPGNTDWVDVPGAGGGKSRPSTWLTSYTLVEFLVSVDKYPEFGILYFVHIVDTKPGAYFIRVLDFGKISPDLAKTIYGTSGQPYCASNGAGVPFPGPKDWVSAKDQPTSYK